MDLRHLREEVWALLMENILLRKKLKAINALRPSEVAEEPWKVVRKRRGNRAFLRSDMALLPSRNEFLALQDECEGDCNRADVGPLPQSKIMSFTSGSSVMEWKKFGIHAKSDKAYSII